MPPTALALRFFSLPKTSMIWLNQLKELRNAILNKKEIISKVKFGRKEIETDKVKKQLTQLIQQHNLIKQTFLSENTSINIVLNNDQLSVYESVRIYKKLKELNLNIANFVLNKVVENHYIEEMKLLAKKPSIVLPCDESQLIGVKELENYLQKKRIFGNLTYNN